MGFVNSSNTFLAPSPLISGNLLISNITNAYPMVITIINSQYNAYQIHQLVYLTVPADYGMFQANTLTGRIIEINGNDFSIDIDSRQFDVFTSPSSVQQPASLSLAGSQNLIFNNTNAKEPSQSLYPDRGN